MSNVEIIKVRVAQVLLCKWVTGNKEFTISGLIQIILCRYMIMWKSYCRKDAIIKPYSCFLPSISAIYVIVRNHSFMHRHATEKLCTTEAQQIESLITHGITSKATYLSGVNFLSLPLLYSFYAISHVWIYSVSIYSRDGAIHFQTSLKPHMKAHSNRIAVNLHLVWPQLELICFQCALVS